MTTLTATSIAGGVTVTWEGILSPTPLDWIALYAVGAPYEAFMSSWAFVSGTKTPGQALASGSFALPLPVLVGEHELRLMANNGSNVLATAPVPNEPVIEPQGNAFWLNSLMSPLEELLAAIDDERLEVQAAMAVKDQRIAFLEGEVRRLGA